MRHGGQEMKKLTIIFLSIFIAIPNVHAAGGDHRLCVRASTGDPCPAGCFYEDTTAGCSPCEPGYYYPTQNSTNECYACTKPNDAIFINSEDTLGNTSDNCPWEVKCAAGQYWDGKTCQVCGQYYDGSTGCTVTGQGTTYPASNLDTVCIGKIFTLTLEKNLTNVWESPKYAYVKYGRGFSDNENGPWHERCHYVVPSLSWWQDFIGYSTAKSQGVQRFNAEGCATDGTDNKTFTTDTTLYGQWNTVSYTVRYYTDSTLKYPLANTEHDCEMGSNTCTASTNIPTQSGKVFAGWACGAGCDPEKTIQPGEQVPEPSEDYGLLNPIKLYASYNLCPAGSYCENNTQTSCPGGSTSDDGAENINKCYMDKGTQFCDSVGCFNLPDGIKIYYQGGD